MPCSAVVCSSCTYHVRVMYPEGDPQLNSSLTEKQTRGKNQNMQALVFPKRSKSTANTPLSHSSGNSAGRGGGASQTIPAKYHHKPTQPSEPRILVYLPSHHHQAHVSTAMKPQETLLCTPTQAHPAKARPTAPPCRPPPQRPPVPSRWRGPWRWASWPPPPPPQPGSGPSRGRPRRPSRRGCRTRRGRRGT